jgi:DNA-binding Xre family transcriptional regulator
MTVEEELKNMMIEKSGSVNKFAQECDLPQTTIASMLDRGVNKANVNTIIKICKHLGLSVDALANGRIAPSPLKSITDSLNAELLNQHNYAKLLGYYEALLESQKKGEEDAHA